MCDYNLDNAIIEAALSEQVDAKPCTSSVIGVGSHMYVSYTSVKKHFKKMQKM